MALPAWCGTILAPFIGAPISHIGTHSYPTAVPAEALPLRDGPASQQAGRIPVGPAPRRLPSTPPAEKPAASDGRSSSAPQIRAVARFLVDPGTLCDPGAERGAFLLGHAGEVAERHRL